jgi:hypothetical protein
MTNLAKTHNYDGDSIAQDFFNMLTDANFHTEAFILEGIWHAMANVDYIDSSDRHKLKKAAIEALLQMEI